MSAERGCRSHAAILASAAIVAPTTMKADDGKLVPSNPTFRTSHAMKALREFIRFGDDPPRNDKDREGERDCYFV